MLVEQFLHLMVGADADRRASSARLLARLHGDERLVESDREALEAAMTLLLDDPVAEVRMALAEAVADHPGVPHHVVLGLAQDLDPIAATVVARSPRFLDGELVDLIAAGSSALQQAAASRVSVPPPIAAALAEVATQTAIGELLLNPGASIAEFSLLRILERFGASDEIRRDMALRLDLPISVRQSLLRHEVTHRFPSRGVRGEPQPHEAGDKETLELSDRADDAEVAALADHLRLTGQLTTALILRAAVTGRMRLVAEALALLADVPARRVFTALERGSDTVVRALYGRAGLPERAYPAFTAAVEVAREVAAEDVYDASYAHVRRMVERIVERYRDRRDDDLDDLVVTLRRYAAEAARDASRRYLQRSLAVPPLLAPAEFIDTGPILKPLIYGADDDALGAAFGVEAEDAIWTEVEAGQIADAA